MCQREESWPATVDDPCVVGANLWPIGAALIFLASTAGLGLVAALVGLAKDRVERRREAGRH